MERFRPISCVTFRVSGESCRSCNGGNSVTYTLHSLNHPKPITMQNKGFLLSVSPLSPYSLILNSEKLPHSSLSLSCCCCCSVTSVMSDSVQPHRWKPTRLPRPWDSPGKNTGVGCHFLLQCIKVKSESEAAQPCLTLSDPVDCSLPGSPVHGIFQARVLEWGAIAFSERTLKHSYKKPALF